MNPVAVWKIYERTGLIWQRFWKIQRSSYILLNSFMMLIFVQWTHILSRRYLHVDCIQFRVLYSFVEKSMITIDYCMGCLHVSVFLCYS